LDNNTVNFEAIVMIFGVLESWDLVIRLPASSLAYGDNSSRHALDELLDQPPRYAPPALLQGLTKAFPLLLSYTEVIVLWVVLIHALFKSPPEALDGVKIRRIGRPVDRVDVVISQEAAHSAARMYTRVVMHEQLRRAIVRQ
jgi:hypothetical protein